ncbi:Uncharacterized protein TCM_030614 [Theobroma cacao]|uniref:Uncharacterized protein n=1 Tax=Theobroma cacao TaxID=3641 RepID=A0A061FBX3_THECC|nr:Uncharacterized protein TCM_030614 [Theobroma cacao]
MLTDSLVEDLPLMTDERKIQDDLEEKLPKPCLARALETPEEHPNGTSGHKINSMSVFLQHVASFDQGNNGITYPWETTEIIYTKLSMGVIQEHMAQKDRFELLRSKLRVLKADPMDV